VANRTIDRLRDNIRTVFLGNSRAVDLLLIGLLGRGHVLIEDVPGVGKTVLARSLARSIDCRFSRIQLTPDLLPSDVLGVSIFNRETNEFDFKPGPVFANIVVGDEINRASPKTQAALLESMEERQVTVDGLTYVLEAPFIVVATQNPLDMEGTYPLPEAQRDRFTARISMGYPNRQSEIDMLSEHAATDPLDVLTPVSDSIEVRALINIVRAVHIAPSMKAYAVDLATATRQSPAIRLGASPRASLQLVRASKAWAAMEGRDYVIPDDMQGLVPHAFGHRMLLTAEAHMSGRGTAEILASIVSSVPIPSAAGEQRVGGPAMPVGDAARHSQPPTAALG
jgi:MoxR-like ATPase